MGGGPSSGRTLAGLSFHFSRDRGCFTATRALLRMILASYLDSNPLELVLQYSEPEKPSLHPSSSVDQLEFNVSHSGSIAMLAFSRGRARGVDMEQLRDNFDHEAIADASFPRRSGVSLPHSLLPSGIMASFDAGPERKPTSRRTASACRFRFTNSMSYVDGGRHMVTMAEAQSLELGS